MKKNLKQIAIVAMVALVFAACKKNQESSTTEPQETVKNADRVLQYIKALGFSETSIVDNGNEYIVEEDISFPKNMEIPENKAFGTEQYYTGSIVNSTNKLNIRVFVDASMTSMGTEINNAIAQWNAVPNSTLRFNIVTTAPYDIIIKNEALVGSPGSTVCGQGEFPANGKAGAVIKINKNAIAGNSFAQRARTICHEFGHNISLKHTNQSTSVNVPGVPGTDPLSLMNGGQCNSGATVLSQKDKDATAVLY